MHKGQTWLTGLFTLMTLISLSSPTLGQAWVKEMFTETSHDFGNVPRGAKAEFMFKLTNKYEEDVHIAQVRSSCGCTIPRIHEKSTLKTYEKGAIACEFNTRSFIGPKAAVVTVVFDRPFYGEMQLTVKGNIRSDIVTEPGEIQFGSVDRGTEKATSVDITYAGKSRWEITGVRSANKYLRASLERKQSARDQIEYRMKVRLLDSAPAGEFNDQIVLVTNDQNFNMVTIPVRGTIVSPLVMPVSIELGTIKSGTAIQKRMIIRGKTPFEIKNIECVDSRMSFTTPEGAKLVHIIPLQFVADAKFGAFKERVVVETSLPTDGTASTMISGNVTN